MVFLRFPLKLKVYIDIHKYANYTSCESLTLKLMRLLKEIANNIIHKIFLIKQYILHTFVNNLMTIFLFIRSHRFFKDV